MRNPQRSTLLLRECRRRRCHEAGHTSGQQYPPQTHPFLPHNANWLDCGSSYHIVCSRQALLRRALELDLVAFWVVEIDRRPVALGAIALDGFANRNAERRKPGRDRVAVERLDAKGEVIHVAT